MPHRAVTATQFRLDHASMEVSHLGGAVGRLDRLLGLQVTVSPQAPEHHGRFPCLDQDADQPLQEERRSPRLHKCSGGL
jgi:hypothetical protein